MGWKSSVVGCQTTTRGQFILALATTCPRAVVRRLSTDSFQPTARIPRGISQELGIKPVARLDKERVVRVRLEQIPEIPSEAEITRPAIRERSPLLPHEEQRRPRPVLPPHNRVRPELLHVEPARISACRVRPVAIGVALGARIRE